MKIKNINLLMSIMLIVGVAFGTSSCSKDTHDGTDQGGTPEDGTDQGGTDQDGTEDDLKDPSEIKTGLTYFPATIDPEKPLNLYYKAGSGDPLENVDEIYLHTGVNEDWIGAGNWNTLKGEVKMTKKSNDAGEYFKAELRPTVKAFYEKQSGKTIKTITTINIVARNKKGNKQTSDIIIPVGGGDSNADFESVKTGAVPFTVKPNGDYHDKYLEGIHLEGNKALCVLRDWDRDGKRHKNAFILCEANEFKASKNFKMTWDETNHCWWGYINDIKDGDNAFQYMIINDNNSALYLADPYCEKAIEKSDMFKAEFPAKAKGRYVSVITKDNYVWKNSDFKLKNQKNMVVYEMLLRDFTNEGNLKGATAKLDYLENLGINAIELMPVQEFGGDDSWGYNTSLYFTLDRSYGEPEEYKAFIDECHSRGIAVILDVVYNHSNGDNPFGKLYPNYAKNPYFADVAGKNYKLIYSNEDFDHKSKLTQDFVKRNLDYFMKEYHLDGFRFDCTKGFINSTSYDEQIPERVTLLKDYAKYAKSQKEDVVIIMEHLLWPEENQLKDAGILCWRNMNHPYCQSAMGYSSESAFSSKKDGEDGMWTTKWISYMESHDEPRMAFKQKKWAVDVVKNNLKNKMNTLATNAAFTLCVPGPKMLWQFGEFGFDKGNAEEEGIGGRCDAVKPDWSYTEVAERKDLLETYSLLMNIRNNNPELFDGGNFYWEATGAYWTNGRSLHAWNGNKELVVVANYTKAPTGVKFIANVNSEGWIDMKTKEELNKKGDDVKIQLNPYSYKIFGRNLTIAE